jgi:hypothetical protein
MEALMRMKKIDLAALERASGGRARHGLTSSDVIPSPFEVSGRV